VNKIASAPGFVSGYNYVLVSTPSAAAASRRLTDLQRSAFWIYGVTAMVMREPFGTTIRHATENGLDNWQVELELLRMIVILLLLARLFLSSGLYFETVYMQANSSQLYPGRSYPTDFLAGLGQFLVGAAATTVIATHSRIHQVLSPFTVVIAAFLLMDAVWLAVALGRRFSSLRLIRVQAGGNLVLLLITAGVGAVCRLAGKDSVFAEQAMLTVVAIGTAAGIASQIRTYETLDS
jgi:hypothetical protein